jgi:tetratricopeptide (TPR) repeat protein
MVVNWDAEARDEYNELVRKLDFGETFVPVKRAERDGKVVLWDGGGLIGGWVDDNDVILLAEAPAYFTRLLADDPSPEHYYHRAIAWEAKGETDLATKDYTQAIALRPVCEYYHARGLLYVKRRKFDEGEADFDKAVALNPNYSFAHCGKASLAYRRQKFDEAIAHASEAIRLDPDYALNHFGRAVARMGKNDLEAAIADLSEALRLYPNYALASAQRSQCYLVLGDPRAAYHDADDAVKHDPHLALAYFNRGQAAEKLAKPGQAVKDYRKTLVVDPNFKLALNALAWIRAASPNRAHRDGAKAVEAAAQACQLTQWKNPLFLQTLAAAYAESNDFVSAVKWQRDAIAKLEPRQAAIKQEMLARLELFGSGQPIPSFDAAEFSAETTMTEDYVNSLYSEKAKPSEPTPAK